MIENRENRKTERELKIHFFESNFSTESFHRHFVVVDVRNIVSHHHHHHNDN